MWLILNMVPPISAGHAAAGFSPEKWAFIASFGGKFDVA
jgi:hypothetical protein